METRDLIFGFIGLLDIVLIGSSINWLAALGLSGLLIYGFWKAE